MSAEQNKDLARRYVLSHDASNPAAALDLVSSEFVLHLAGFPHQDRDGYLQTFGAYKAAFPDMRHTIEDQVAEGDRVVTRATVHATHLGEFQGMPPTGKAVSVNLIAIDRIVEGKIAEEWSVMDILGLMQQLGAIPSPEQATA